jgi:hypothetical protein
MDLTELPFLDGVVAEDFSAVCFDIGGLVDKFWETVKRVMRFPNIYEQRI